MDQAVHAPSLVPVEPTDEGPLLEIIAHLGAALMQVDTTDDPIIVGHVRAAHSLAVFLHRCPGQHHA